MGCVSSKILTRTQSLNEEVRRSFKSQRKGFESLVVSQNNNDQILALLRTANTVAKKLNEESPASKTENTALKLTGSKSIEVKEADHDTYRSSNVKDIETINTLDLLDGLDDQQQRFKFADRSGGRSFRTVEDFDAMLAKNQSNEAEKSLISECSSSSSPVSSEHDAAGDDSQIKKVDIKIEKVWKRKAMAKELTTLKFSPFEFSRTGSLREWLITGGQLQSPGSYITPKFGDFKSSADKNIESGSENSVFDPVLISEFEEAMQKLTIEEEFILKQIVESQEEVNADINS
ncbi:hypothetical protein DsansV1_C16g0140731 [Dioscorea sansibarensis]